MGRGSGIAVVAATPKRRGRPTLWTDERIEEKLREVINETGGLPSMAELRGRGLSSMAKAIGRKGLAFHAGRVGLPGVAAPPPTQALRTRRAAKTRRGPYKWTDERIEEELRRLVAENDGRFPTRVELESGGHHGLRQALQREGINYWAGRLGVELSAGQDREPYGIEEARRDVGRVVAEAGRLPGGPVLRKLGYGRLATFISGGGGTAKFCATHRIQLPD
jgi:hypothetical protein